jgi:diguanylate cyclase (GGDEF)-like protein
MRRSDAATDQRGMDLLRPIVPGGGQDSATTLPFAARLCAAVALAFVTVGVFGYVSVSHLLRRNQVDRHAFAHRIVITAIEHMAEQPTVHQGIGEVDRLLKALSRQSGTVEMLLIDARTIVQAAGDEEHVGQRDADPRVTAALRHGARYAGLDAGSRDPGNFVFIAPVNLPGGRYAFEVTYSHAALDAELRSLRHDVILYGLVAAILGAAVFYLVGGRSLLGSHRIALQRSTRDGLTDLPNQRAFQDEFEAAVAAAARHQLPLALAVLDLDDFKFLNDRHGHPHGDALLKRVSAVLRESRSGDRAYRIGGDEFALLCPHTDTEGAMALATRLSRTLTDAGVSASIGIATLRDGHSAGGLRGEADAALYEAKRRGTHVEHYQDIQDAVVLTTTDKRDAVRRLIDEGRLTIVFQPIWNLSSGELIGIEALTRPDPCYGLTGPDEAFEIAAQMGHVHELDVLCAIRALDVAASLPDDALLFINLSPHTLDIDATGNDWLLAAVERAGLPADRVVVEVTERFSGRTASVVKCTQRLRDQGFKLALDDVGAGNSGLEMLRLVDAEFVKIDRSIVAAAATEHNARGVLMAMAGFAHTTGAFVIAEGIEDQDTLAFLQHIDTSDPRPETLIQGGQGYGLGRPAPDLPTDAPGLLAALTLPVGR